MASIIGGQSQILLAGIWGRSNRDWCMEMINGHKRCDSSLLSHLLDMLVVRVHLRGERDPPCLVTPLTMNELVKPWAVLIQ